MRVLSVHADYRCLRRGTCCRAGWPVPVEADLTSRLGGAITRGALQPRAGGDVFESPSGAPPDTPVVLSRPGGLCIFFDDGSPARCRVHASLGHGDLPLACRQFPRVTVRDPRGASVTLSHYCPTAAALLDSDDPVGIVTDAPGFAAGGDYVGLDATKALPPLLRPDMAMDWESWWELERLAVDRIGNGTADLDADLASLRGAIDEVRTWSPGDGPLVDTVRRAFRATVPRDGRRDPARALQTIVDAIPGPLRAQVPSSPAGTSLPPAGRTLRNLLTAHAFASWTACLGLGLDAWGASVDAVRALAAAGWSAGEIDLMVRHLADPWVLARSWTSAGPGRVRAPGDSRRVPTSHP